MKISLVLLVLAALFALSNGARRDRTKPRFHKTNGVYRLGVKGQNDEIILQRVFERPRTPHRETEYTAEINQNLDGTQRIITAMRVRNLNEPFGAKPEFVSGGIGKTNVVLKFKSKRNKAIQSELIVYGRRAPILPPHPVKVPANPPGTVPAISPQPFPAPAPGTYPAAYPTPYPGTYPAAYPPLPPVQAPIGYALPATATTSPVAQVRTA